MTKVLPPGIVGVFLLLMVLIGAPADSGLFTNVSQAQDAPGALVLSTIPAAWAVHFVTNSAKTRLTMYTSGGGALSDYQTLVGAMRTNPPAGMGNAFDPGPSFGGYNTTTWQWLATNGYPSIAYSVIFLTNATPSPNPNSRSPAAPRDSGACLGRCK